MKYKIAVFGLGSGLLSEENKNDAYLVGKAIAEKGHFLVTGLAKGVTEYASKGAKSNNGIVIGINPYSSELEKYEDVSFENTDIVINTGLGDRGRNVISVRTCDGMIVINGNFGVLNEITIGVGEDKPIVVIKNSGGVAEIIPDIFNSLKPEYENFKLVDNAKEALPTLEQMMEYQKNKHK